MSDEVMEIIEELSIYDGEYPAELVDAAVERKDEIIPHLITLLEKVLEDPEPFAEDETFFGHIYAVMLLAHFRSVQAHEVIVKIFSLPGNMVEELFGELGTDNLPSLLVLTCGGDLDRIRAMGLDRKVNDDCRISALHAMGFAVTQGMISREEVLDLYATLFTGDEAGPDSGFWGLLVCLATELCPDRIKPVLDRAYEQGLIEPGIIGPSEIEASIKMGKEACLAQLEERFRREDLSDIHQSMSWWACFNEDAGMPVPFTGTFAEPSPDIRRQEEKRKQRNREKRKRAEASKRKNRR